MPFVLAWLAGETMIIYKSARTGGPPVPGRLLASSLLFAALGLLGEAQQARFLALALAWGFDAAAFLCLFNQTPQNCGGYLGPLTGQSKLGFARKPPAKSGGTVAL